MFLGMCSTFRPAGPSSHVVTGGGAGVIVTICSILFTFSKVSLSAPPAELRSVGHLLWPVSSGQRRDAFRQKCSEPARGSGGVSVQ